MAAKRKTPTKKNISFESLDSVDLKKEVDLKAGTDAVQTTVKKVTPPTKKAPEKAKPAPPKEKEKKEELIRVTVDIPKSEHKRLKIAAMEADLKLYQYVLRIIRAEIGKK